MPYLLISRNILKGRESGRDISREQLGCDLGKVLKSHEQIMMAFK